MSIIHANALKNQNKTKLNERELKEGMHLITECLDSNIHCGRSWGTQCDFIAISDMSV